MLLLLFLEYLRNCVILRGAMILTEFHFLEGRALYIKKQSWHLVNSDPFLLIFLVNKRACFEINSIKLLFCDTFYGPLVLLLSI